MRAETSGLHRLKAGGLKVVIETRLDAYESKFGPRFDRTAAVRSVKTDGREWLGEWGLVDEFGIDGGDATPGYNRAGDGSEFVKVGFGRLVASSGRDASGRTALGQGYDFTFRYPVRERFPVEITFQSARRLALNQFVPGLYDYSKEYEVKKGGILIVRYRIENHSRRAWTVDHYNHHWFAVAPPPPGPAWRLRLGGLARAPEAHASADGWTAEPDDELLMPARVVGQRKTLFWTTRREVEPQQNHFLLEDLQTGDSVEFTGDYPRHRVAVYVDDTCFCPEVFLARKVPPGETYAWSAAYRFRAFNATEERLAFPRRSRGR